MAAAKVLLIDDDEDFVRINRAYLEQAGFHVLDAFSGEEGLAVAKDEHPDLVILDYMMAWQTEGSLVALAMREDAQLHNTPIILLTSVRSQHPWWGIEKSDKYLPVDVILDKPVRPDRLISAIKTLLSQKQPSAG
ncbi:MAG: response regulator [Dehalococcoidales bacterium]|nr:response regulator [Dehalococcoidales bacterium]